MTRTSAPTLATDSQFLPIAVVLTAGIIAMSFAAIFIRLAQNAGVPSLLIASSRLVIAALLIMPITLRRHATEIRRINNLDWLLLMGSGVFLAIHFASWVSSLEYTTVLISVTLVTTTPIWTALLEFFVLRVSLRRTLVIGLVIALLGGLLIGIPSDDATITPSSNIGLGSVLALIGAVTVSGYLIIGRKVQENLSLLPYIWVVYGTAGIALSLIVLFQNIPLLGYTWVGYAAIFASAAIPQLIGHTSLNYAVRHVSATYVSIATKLEPIGSAVWAYLIFAEVPTRWQVIGSIVITVGIVIASLKPPTAPKKTRDSR